MTEPTKDPADPNLDPGGEKDPSTKTVTREAYERLLSEKKTQGTKLKDLETRLSAFESAKAAADEAEAKKRGEFEKLLGERDTTLKTVNEELAALRTEKLENRKLGSFVKALGSQIDPKYFDLVRLEKIKTDADGKVDQASLAEYVKEYKETYPETLAEGGKPGMPGTKPLGGGAKLTREAWLALPTKEKKERLSEVVANEK